MSKPILKLCGITASDELSSDIEAAYFHPKHKFTLAEYEARIRQNYCEIAELNLIKDEPPCLDSRLMSTLANTQRIAAMHSSMMTVMTKPIVIARQSQDTIKVFAEQLNIRLSNDFFDIGNLRYQHISLALRNDGSAFDEDVTVPANYFRYESSDFTPEMLLLRNSLRGLPNSNRNLIEEWNELFPYFMTVDEGSDILEITFNEIMQHTAIAFPTVLLLKNPVTSIKYEIRSKSLPEAIYGTLTIALKEDDIDGNSK